MVRMVGMVLMGWMVEMVGDGNIFVQLVRLELCPCVAETVGGEVADKVVGVEVGLRIRSEAG